MAIPILLLVSYLGWDWCSGYHASDSSIMGFSHTHVSGTGCPEMGDILLMPRTGTKVPGFRVMLAA